MAKYPELFRSAVRSLGVYVDRSGEIFIDHRDVTKAQQKQICKLAKQYGMEIVVCDKGAVFN